MTVFHQRTRTGCLILLALFSLGLTAPTLAASEPPRLGLTPIGVRGHFFDLQLRPGQTAKLRVELASFGVDDVRARTYASDAYSLINGGFGAKLFGAARSGTTRWLSYEARELTLAPRGSLTIDFRVTVPSGAPPGEYIAAVVAENAEPFRGSAGPVTIDQVDRVALAVAIDVPGARSPALEIGRIGHKEAAGTSFISFEVANPGNVHLKPTGQFILRDAAGTQLVHVPAVMDSVYARSATLFELPLATSLAPGNYCAELSLTDKATGASDATGCLPFSIPGKAASASGTGLIPTRELAGAATQIPVAVPLLTAVLALLAAVWLVWRRRRHPRAGLTRPR